VPFDDSRAGLGCRLWRQIQPLLSFSEHKRPLGFLLVAALSTGLPVFVGAGVGQFAPSMIASMGGLVILYLRQTPLAHRMTSLAVCAFGFALCFALGVLTSFNILLSSLTLVLSVVLVTVICRYFSVPPPGSFFFTLVACLARTLPFDLSLAAERTGILLFGCMGACLLGLAYSLIQMRFQPAAAQRPVEPRDPRVVAILLEALVIGLFVGGGYLAAHLAQLENPYWVPVSTAAIMQGATFRVVWHRNVHRIVGTAIGMGLAWLIFLASPGNWTLAALILVLSFVIELLVTRNYGLAVVFITPLTVIFAEAASASADPGPLMAARLLDIVIGSCIGYVGGWVIHHPTLFQSLERWLTGRWSRA